MKPKLLALKKYLLQMTVGFVAYGLGMWAWLHFYNKQSPHPFWPIIFPVLPLLYICSAIIRFISEGLDEMQRKVVTEAMAFSGLATGFTCISYVFVSVSGGPYFRPDWAFYMMWIYCVIGIFISSRRYK
jgi:hypothetical protein